MAVSIFSIIEHNRKEDLCFHILDDGISEQHRRELTEWIASEGQNVRFYPVGKEMERLKEDIPGLTTGKFRITTLARLFLGSILPETVTKALYLDCDTVTLRSLHGLYAWKLGNHVAAMAPEPTVYPEVRELVGLTETEPYYNAGVILLNLSKWRELGLEGQSLCYYREMDGQLPFNDQDILNHLLRGKVLCLFQRYNFFSNYYYFRYAAILKESPWYAARETDASFHKAKHHPVIVHFAGDERPWFRGSHNHYRRAYELCLRETPFAGARKQEGKELYMAAYFMMNLLTFLCPVTRKWISHTYYQRSVREHFNKDKEKGKVKGKEKTKTGEMHGTCSGNT